MCLETYVQSQPCVKTKLPMQCIAMLLVPEIQHPELRNIEALYSDILLLEGIGGP